MGCVRCIGSKSAGYSTVESNITRVLAEVVDYKRL